jgi:hypothetical protein
MALVLIAVQAGYLDKDKITKQLKSVGNDCHALENVWVLSTDKDVSDVFKQVEAVVKPGDRFIVAPLAGKWASYNARSADECFEY